MTQAAEPSSPPRLNSLDDLTPPPPPSPPFSPPASPLSNPLVNSSSDQKDACARDPFIVHNGHKFNLSALPSRVMFYRNMYWEDFQGKTLESLCSGFLKRTPSLLLEVEGHKYIFDFTRMLQVHVASKSFRSIAWIDERGKPFFHAKFFDHDFSQEKMEEDHGRADEKEKEKMEEDDDDNRDKRNEKMEVCDGLGSKTHSLEPKPKFPSTKLLTSDDKMYKFASNLSLKHMTKIDPEAVVTNVHEFRVMGEFGRVRKDVLERQIEITEAKRGKANVVYAWYAAPTFHVAGILALGFDLPTHKNSVFQLPSLGAGIFLADVESPQYSALQYPVHQDPEKHVVLCRVVLGNVEKVQIESNQTSPSREEFDTGSDDPKNPNWYVVWDHDMNRRITPICVVSCKATGIVTVEWKIFFCEVAILPRLISEIKKRILIFNVPALNYIYEMFRSKMVNRDVFIRQFRSIAGDRVIWETTKAIMRS